jgi:hypothetical protein
VGDNQIFPFDLDLDLKTPEFIDEFLVINMEVGAESFCSLEVGVTGRVNKPLFWEDFSVGDYFFVFCFDFISPKPVVIIECSSNVYLVVFPNGYTFFDNLHFFFLCALLPELGPLASRCGTSSSFVQARCVLDQGAGFNEPRDLVPPG